MSQTLYTLTREKGRIGDSLVDTERLQRIGLDVMARFGLDESRYTEEDVLNKTGGIRSRVYTLGEDSSIEFVRQTTHVMLDGEITDDLSEIPLNRAKWIVRFNEDPEYMDNCHP